MNNIEIEKAVLFYMIFRKEQCELTEEDFVDSTNKAIIRAINLIKLEKQEITMLGIQTKIDGNYPNILEYISDLGQYVFMTNFETLYKELKKNTKKRQIMKLMQLKITEIPISENIDAEIEEIIGEMKDIEFQDKKEENFLVQLSNTVKEIEENLGKEEDYSLYTGFLDLDSMTDGLHNGELTVIGARPGVGKTTFALQIAEKIASRGKEVAYISLEMSENQIIYKLLSRRTRVNSRKIRNGKMDEKEFEKVSIATGEISSLKFNILTKASTIQQIELEARRLKNQDRLDLLVIDYLQLVRNANKFGSREQEVADISRTLKLLSLELDIPIIALCQLNRNAVRQEPTLADIRESGAIEQDADNVIFLYQKNPENNIVTVDLQKQRGGNIGATELKFQKQNSEFINIVWR